MNLSKNWERKIREFRKQNVSVNCRRKSLRREIEV